MILQEGDGEPAVDEPELSESENLDSESENMENSDSEESDSSSGRPCLSSCMKLLMFIPTLFVHVYAIYHIMVSKDFQHS